jgi:hypothetical protein
MERGFVGEGEVVCARQPGSKPTNTHAIIVTDAINHVGKILAVRIHDSSLARASLTQG